MTEFLLNLITENPWLLYVLLFIVGVFIILVVYSVVKGRDVSVGPLKFGPGSSPTTTTEPVENQVSQQQIQPVFVYGPPQITKELLDEVKARVAEEVRGIKQEMGDETSGLLYQPAELPRRIRYIYEARHEMETLVKRHVLSKCGGWSGCSYADFSVYMKKAREVLPNGILSNIKDFYIFTAEYLNAGKVNDLAFWEIQYLAGKILMQLKQIPLDPFGRPGD